MLKTMHWHDASGDLSDHPDRPAHGKYKEALEILRKIKTTLAAEIIRSASRRGIGEEQLPALDLETGDCCLTFFG